MKPADEITSFEKEKSAWYGKPATRPSLFVSLFFSVSYN